MRLPQVNPSQSQSQIKHKRKHTHQHTQTQNLIQSKIETFLPLSNPTILSFSVSVLTPRSARTLEPPLTRGISSFQSFKIARSFSSLQNRNITSPRFTSNDGKIEIQNIDTLQDILEEKIMKFSSERSISTEKDNNNVNENIEIFDENVNRSNSFNTKKTKNQSFTTNNKENDNKNQRDNVKNISFNTSLNCASADSNSNSVIYDNNNDDNNSDDNNTNDKINIFSNNNHNNNNINNNNNNSINNNNNNKNKIQKRTSLIFEPWSKNIIKIASKEIFDNDKSQVLELYIDKAINLPENCTVARYDFNFIFTIVTIIIIIVIIIIIIIIIIFTIVIIIIIVIIIVIIIIIIIIIVNIIVVIFYY